MYCINGNKYINKNVNKHLKLVVPAAIDEDV
jgi:hypothetical protein